MTHRRPTSLRAFGILLALILPPAAGAQTAEPASAPSDTSGPGRQIAAVDYFVAEAGRAWSFVDARDEHERAVLSVTGGGEGSRVTFRFPRKDGATELEFSLRDGVLLLHAFRIRGKNLSTGRVVLEPPARLGAPHTPLEGGAVTAPMRTGCTLRVGSGVLQQTINVAVVGKVSAHWSAHAPVTVPAGTYQDVVGLRLGLDLNLTATLAGVDVQRRAQSKLEGVLARDVGYVQLDTAKRHWRLLVDPRPAAER